MKSRLSVLKRSAAALIAFAPLAYLTPAAAVEGYVTSGQDPNQPVRTRYGECIHSYDYRPGMRFADCEPAPTPVAAPAPKVEPAPAPVVEAPKPIPQDVPFRLATETFFDFDKATLTPEGRAALDDVAARLAVSQYNRITVVGHTDRIGTVAYNQKLSERRAHAMADYLVAKGVEAQKIAASGLGERNPSAQCPGLRGAKLIACLQPDRFAELTTSGTVQQASAAAGSN
jgi:OOP family OmpA-OmpF porin